MSEIVIVVTGQTGPSGGAGTTALDDLTDVTITAAASGDILRHNGTAWVDAVGTTHFEVAGAAATAQAAAEATASAALSAHTGDTVDAHDASAISFVAGGTIAGTDVQTAVAEVATDAASALSTHAAVTSSVHGISAFGATLVDDADASAARTTLGLVIGTNVQAQDAELAAIAGLTSAADRVPYFTGSGTASLATFTAAGRALVDDADAAAQRTTLGLSEVLIIPIGDETTAITTGTAKVTFRMPFALTVTAVRASLTTVSSSGIPTFDINDGGTTILSTKLTIDANEKTSTTAATAAVISDTALADDAEITIDVDVAGTGAAGAKIYIIGTRP